MIIKRCDLCNKQVDDLDTLILYRRGFDFCKECKSEAKSIAKKYKETVKQQIDIRLIEEENKALSYVRLFKRRTEDG